MCGRATLKTPPDALAELFHLDELPNIAPRFNVAPGQPVAILRAIPGEPEARRLEQARWGVAQREPLAEGARRAPQILVRLESLFTRPMFRDAATKRRCLVVVDGFYEWQGDGRHRQPFHFQRRDGLPFALAAIWEPADGGVLECALLTTAALPPVREIHDRMPIPIAAGDHTAWLDPARVDERTLRPLAVVDPGVDLVASPVSTFVNDAAHEGAECIAPAIQRSLF